VISQAGRDPDLPAANARLTAALDVLHMIVPMQGRRGTALGNYRTPRSKFPHGLMWIVLALAMAACGGEAERGPQESATIGDATSGVEPASAPATPTYGATTCEHQEDLPLGNDQIFREVGPDGREYQLFIPASYRADRPAPLVIELHGAGGDAAIQEGFSSFEELAEEAGFILARPQAEPPGFWSLYDDTDVDYVLDAIADARTVVCLDTARVYAAGMSQGGHLAVYLACLSPGTFSAVASVAVLDHPFDCDPDPTPLVAFAGRNDAIYRVATGLDRSIFAQTSVTDPPAGARPGPLAREAGAWASTNGCRAEPAVRSIGASIQRWSYHCTDAPLEIFLHQGGHTWPGELEGLDATSIIWAFFERQEL